MPQEPQEPDITQGEKNSLWLKTACKEARWALENPLFWEQGAACSTKGASKGSGGKGKGSSSSSSSYYQGLR